MMTLQQRRKLEAGLSTEERSIAATGRHAKAVILALLVLALTLIGADGTSDARQAQPAPTLASSAAAGF